MTKKEICATRFLQHIAGIALSIELDLILCGGYN